MPVKEGGFTTEYAAAVVFNRCWMCVLCSPMHPQQRLSSHAASQPPKGGRVRAGRAT